MLKKDSEYRLDIALADDKIGDEVAARLISSTPADAAAAQAILDILDTSLKMERAIAERLYVALAGDRDGAAGKELAKKINGAVDVLKAQANGEEVEAEFAFFEGQVAGMTTDVRIEADDAGAAGNSILLEFDGIDDIDAAIAAWNLANPANTASLISGDGSQVPDNLEEIELAGGSDSSDADIAASKAAMGSDLMSDSAFECLVSALASREAAEDFKSAYNAMIVAVQAIS